MSTNGNTDSSTGSLAELFHLVGRLVPEGQRLVAAPPTMTVAEALQLMGEHNFSQLPVVAGRTVLGVFSYRSLAQRLRGMREVPEDFGSLPVDEFVEQFRFVQPSDNWASILPYLDREDGVLVGHREQLEGILTPMDVLGYLQRIASPFVMVAEIERSLRRIISACVDGDELRTCIQNSLAQKYGEDGLPTKLEEMTFADYVQIIGDGRNWPQFTAVFGEGEWQRKTTAARLKQVGELRNEVFHFRRDMLPQDLEILSGRRDWLQMKARAFEGAKAVKTVPAKKKEATAAPIEAPTRRAWAEASFFETLEEEQGAAEAAAARGLYEWVVRRGLFFRWGTGKVQGTFSAVVGNEKGPAVLRIWTSGWVTIPFGGVRHLPPFDSEGTRLQLLRRLNTLPGANIPMTATRKENSIKLAPFVDEAALEQLTSILDWMLGEIEQAAAAGAVMLVPPSVAGVLDPSAVERLQHFLANLQGIGFVREEGSSQDTYKVMLPYKSRGWDEHRPHPVTVLSLRKGTKASLRFRIDMLSSVKDLDVDELQRRLLSAGCTRANRKTTPVELVLARRNDQATLDRILAILQDLVRQHGVA